MKQYLLFISVLLVCAVTLALSQSVGLSGTTPLSSGNTEILKAIVSGEGNVTSYSFYNLTSGNAVAIGACNSIMADSCSFVTSNTGMFVYNVTAFDTGAPNSLVFNSVPLDIEVVPIPTTTTTSTSTTSSTTVTSVFTTTVTSTVTSTTSTSSTSTSSTSTTTTTVNTTTIPQSNSTNQTNTTIITNSSVVNATVLVNTSTTTVSTSATTSTINTTTSSTTIPTISTVSITTTVDPSASTTTVLPKKIISIPPDLFWGGGIGIVVVLFIIGGAFVMRGRSSKDPDMSKIDSTDISEIRKQLATPKELPAEKEEIKEPEVHKSQEGADKHNQGASSRTGSGFDTETQKGKGPIEV